MVLHEFSKILIATVEALPLLDGRYTNIRCVNVKPGKDEKRGCFSLVFCAVDITDGSQVALKFFDPDPAVTGNIYRAESFERESAILKHLLKSQRCLQLVQELRIFEIDLPLASGKTVKVPCKYFAVEWLDHEIDDFFLRSSHDSIEKLRVFNNIILAVQALHRREVFHRDLKADNLRMANEALGRVIVAIDLGTAARFASAHLSSDYEHQVGAPAYSPPEARCGLAGNRQIAHCGDIYALGCLLFELFNKDHYFEALRRCNPDYDHRIFGMSAGIDRKADEATQIRQWRDAVSKYQPGLVAVDIGGPGAAIEPAIAPPLNELLQRLCHVDYTMRDGVLPFVRSRVKSLITLLSNEAAYQRRLEVQREARLKRVEKAKAYDRRIDALNNKGIDGC